MKLSHAKLPLMTPRLRLRPYAPADAMQLADVFEDVAEANDGGYFAPLLLNHRIEKAAGGGWWLAMFAGSEYVGEVIVSGSDINRKIWQVGYGLRPGFRRAGLMTEALTYVLRAMVGEDATMVEAIVEHSNPHGARSVKVLRRCGFDAGPVAPYRFNTMVYRRSI